VYFGAVALITDMSTDKTLKRGCYIAFSVDSDLQTFDGGNISGLF
jgi:hypothetical protein